MKTTVSGVRAERTKFSTYICYSIPACTIIYPASGRRMQGRDAVGNSRKEKKRLMQNVSKQYKTIHFKLLKICH
jgi:hypothetical protein